MYLLCRRGLFALHAGLLLHSSFTTAAFKTSLTVQPLESRLRTKFGGVWSLNPDPVGVFRGGHCILELAWRSEHLPSWAWLRGTCKVYARLVGFTNIKSGRHLTLGTITSLFLGCVWLWVQGIPAVQCAHRRKFKETYYWEQGRFTWIGKKSEYCCSKDFIWCHRFWLFLSYTCCRVHFT